MLVVLFANSLKNYLQFRITKLRMLYNEKDIKMGTD
jgi:hypothetical protein